MPGLERILSYLDRSFWWLRMKSRIVPSSLRLRLELRLQGREMKKRILRKRTMKDLGWILRTQCLQYLRQGFWNKLDSSTMQGSWRKQGASWKKDSISSRYIETSILKSWKRWKSENKRQKQRRKRNNWNKDSELKISKKKRTNRPRCQLKIHHYLWWGMLGNYGTLWKRINKLSRNYWKIWKCERKRKKKKAKSEKREKEPEVCIPPAQNAKIRKLIKVWCVLWRIDVLEISDPAGPWATQQPILKWDLSVPMPIIPQSSTLNSKTVLRRKACKARLIKWINRSKKQKEANVGFLLRWYREYPAKRSSQDQYLKK